MSVALGIESGVLRTWACTLHSALLKIIVRAGEMAQQSRALAASPPEFKSRQLRSQLFRRLRQEHQKVKTLSWNSLCTPGWPQTHQDPPVSASQRMHHPARLKSLFSCHITNWPHKSLCLHAGGPWSVRAGWFSHLNSNTEFPAKGPLRT